MSGRKLLHGTSNALGALAGSVRPAIPRNMQDVAVGEIYESCQQMGLYLSRDRYAATKSD